MTDFEKRFASLSPEKRKLLLRQLGGQNTASESDSQPIQPYPRDTDTFPISFSQERLWFLDQLDPGNYAYNMPGAIHLRGELNLVCLEQALQAILARHEVLRTNFNVVDGAPVQIISPIKPLPLTIIDLCNFPSETRMAEARRLIGEEARKRFDLRSDLLVRATLLKLDDDDHIFLLTIHHIVNDGWSRGIFVRELTALYKAFLAGLPNPLPPLPIQYADFAQWQREWLQGDRLESQLAYWKKQLDGNLPELELLLDKPRPPIQSLNSAHATLHLPIQLAQALRRLSREENATLFMTMLAAFKLLLHRYTELEDIVIGSPIAGRNRAELENLMGFFLNTLVLRTDLSGDPEFRELIRRVRKTAMDAYAHQDIPFEKLLIELHPERNLSRTPLFQVFFNMLNLETGWAGIPGLQAEIIEMPDIGSKFDLTLYLIENEQGINLRLVYNTDLFTSDRIKEMLHQYEYILTQIAEDPGKRIDEYSLVTTGASGLLPDPAMHQDSTWYGAVHEKFTENAANYPGRTALVDDNGSWTYDDLERLTNQLSHFLRRNGLDSGQVVAVFGHRSAAVVWAIIGILKAGGAFMIIDPAYPVRRQLEYLEIANPRGFIQLEAAGNLPSEVEQWAANSTGTCRVSLPAGPPVTLKDVLHGYPSTNPGIPVRPEDTAYIAFTSGSTGRPKGVIGRHGPLSHFIPWQSETFAIGADDRFSMLSGLSHDPLQRDIFTALWLGASIHIPDPEQVGRPGWLNQWMRREKITFSHLTPAMAQILATGGSLEHTPDQQIATLRYVFFVGDKITRHDVNQLGRLSPHVICIISYGSTETQRAVGYHLVDPRESTGAEVNGFHGRAVIPVGRGMKDVQLLVLTGTRMLAGIGELGEIYVRSPHLAQGYLGDESLTRERFIVNPFTGDPADRLYRSGDLGRYLPDGNVEFLGRKDTQVKIRGFRVELGEIETVLNEHPAVGQTVVDTWTPVQGDVRLIAYVVPKDKDHGIAGELLDYLRSRLPAHMIPVKILFLDAIPITPNGKINRAVLPHPGEDERAVRQEQVDARNKIEQGLVHIWQDLLRNRKIGVKDNFFELGGHSLMAVHMFTKISETFGANLPLSTLFQEPTIENLARAIQRDAGQTAWSSLIEIEPLGSHPPFFCIHGITGDILWFRDLARCLTPDYPFFGLQARGLDGIQDPFDNIADMAAYYIREIHRRQPQGPYYLGGASFGGTVALEIAQQLLQQGEQVALLAIFDHSPPNINLHVDQNSFKGRLHLLKKVIRNFPHWFREFRQLGVTRMLQRLGRKLRLIKKAGRQPDLVNTDQIDATDLIDFAPDLPAHRQQLITTHYRAMKEYFPLPYPGEVTLFRARSRPLLNPNDPEDGWRQLAPGRVVVFDIPSSHEGMFTKPHVFQLAEKLKSRLG